jgi:3-methyladenine DNA glycosylase AlkD
MALASRFINSWSISGKRSRAEHIADSRNMWDGKITKIRLVVYLQIQQWRTTISIMYSTVTAASQVHTVPQLCAP